MLVSKNDAQGIKTEVELTMTDGSVIYGEMYLCAEQQVLDILNGDRQFLPFEGLDGNVSVINKTAIAKIIQYDKRAAGEEKLLAFVD